MLNTSYQKLKQFVIQALSWLWENKIKILKVCVYFLLAVLIKSVKMLKKPSSYLWKNSWRKKLTRKRILF